MKSEFKDINVRMTIVSRITPTLPRFIDANDSIPATLNDLVMGWGVPFYYFPIAKSDNSFGIFLVRRIVRNKNNRHFQFSI
jgi:hypothetical protein